LVDALTDLLTPFCLVARCSTSRRQATSHGFDLTIRRCAAASLPSGLHGCVLSQLYVVYIIIIIVVDFFKVSRYGTQPDVEY